MNTGFAGDAPFRVVSVCHPKTAHRVTKSGYKIEAHFYVKNHPKLACAELLYRGAAETRLRRVDLPMPCPAITLPAIPAALGCGYACGGQTQKGLHASTAKCYLAPMTKPSEVVDIVKSAQNELSIGMLCAFFGSGLLLTCHVLWVKWDESEMFWKVVYPLMLGGCIYFGLRSFSRLQTALEGICNELKHGIYSHLLKGEEMERFHEWEKDEAWLKTIENKRRVKDTGDVERG